ncbi:DUF1835 domain-containing protein [Lysinibacillus sp. ZYM-1]|uniref:DUF1835 domain-containing protein n=1 Tax=Lysinibacillus sp. ZYM-1 TaxID=1681184 RepID=UPI0006CE6211|nr:DUF1835 domain-containing protein [Lysinibacillus sp. ZYM-1]KPN96256.1 hypothetical protein AO843_17640 [Lysinibacillus sp. ZYM-1]
MITEIKELVIKSSEEEVKSLLFHILLRISMEQNDEDLVKDLKSTYSNFLNYKDEQKQLEDEKDYKAAHVVFGDSSSGSLKIALRDMRLLEEEKIIHFSDNFSIGPVWKLEEDKGLAQRHKWLMNHLNMDEDYLFNYQDVFKETIAKIKSIPEQVNIFIWFGENADEQTALRYVLYLLKGKTNNIFLIHTTNLGDTPIHTSEIEPNQLKMIYERSRTGQHLKQEERENYEQEWLTLSNCKGNLRVWGNEALCLVDDDYYDDYILQTAKKLQLERRFLKSARLIGEIIGNLNQSIGDQYFEYRLIHLIFKGVFEMEGVPKAMRFYSVKLREV